MRKKDAEEALVVNKIFERDIDLLLVEELRCNRDFLNLFLTKAGWPEDYETVETYHSKYMTYGEADVEAVLTYPDGSCRVLLIEDKINAETQKDQSQRYTENAEEILKDVKFSEVKAFLVAPEKYIKEHKNDHNIAEFKTQITYEELIAFYEKDPLKDARSRYKAELLSFAVGKQKRQTVKVVDPDITKFWCQLRAHIDAHYKDLELTSKVIEKSKNDEYWASWRTKISGVRIYWKADHGYVDIQVEKCPGREKEFIQKFGDKLLPGMCIRQASNSVVFRMENHCWKMSFSKNFKRNIQRVDHVLSYVSMVHSFIETLPEDVFQ